MAIIYYPISSSMYVRDTSNPNYQQLVLSLNPNTILHFDATSSLLDYTEIVSKFNVYKSQYGY